ncbi:YVTN family beta-propeller protein [Streptacidiphilus sp. MAP12-33]|uniref:hypothetical protein n=1 Tax=Streptacidiphilus sp. MAP12-33 TaxID=3156266 RepID=UPI0035186A6B
MIKHVKAAVGLPVLLLAGGLTALSTSAHAATDPGVALPLSHFSHLAVDAAHGRLFLSGGAGSDALAITDLTGASVGTVPGEPGATSLQLSPDGTTLFAALPGSDAISAIDTTTLQSTSIPTGAGTHPDSLAVAGGRLWFGYTSGSGGSGAGAIGSVDLTTHAVALAQDPGTWTGSPLLAAAPTGATKLVAADPTGTSRTFSVYDAAGGTLTRSTTATLTVPGMTDLAVGADEADVYVESGSTADERLHTADLTTDGPQLRGDTDSSAVAVAPDGTVAAGGDGNELFTYAPHQTDLGWLNEYFSTSVYLPAPHGLAWAPDGSKLFVVATGMTSGAPELLVEDAPETARTVLGGTSPQHLAPGEQFTLDATVFSGEPLPAGAVLSVTRDGVALPDRVVPSAPTNDHTWTVALPDTAPTQGSLTYVLSYAGDATHHAAIATVTVPVARYAPTVTLTSPTHETAIDRTVAFTGTVGWLPHAEHTGEAVRITRTDAAHPAGVLVTTVPVAANGSFAFSDAPHVDGDVSYQATSVATGAYLASSSAADTVLVDGLKTTLTMATDRGSYTYGALAKVTVHLGTTDNSRTVKIWTLAYDHSSATLAATVTADRNGNATAYVKVTENGSIEAWFEGDLRYSATGAGKSVPVQDAVSAALHGYYATSSGWRLYHHTTKQTLTVSVAPAKPGQCLRLLAQRYYGGAWHTVADLSCVRLGSGSSASYSLAFTGPLGAEYRVAAEGNPTGADHANAAGWSSWQYFAIRT